MNAELTHLVGRVDHIKLLDQLQGNKDNTKLAAGKLELLYGSIQSKSAMFNFNSLKYTDIVVMRELPNSNELKFVQSVSARRDKNEQICVKKTTAHRLSSFSNQ